MKMKKGGVKVMKKLYRRGKFSLWLIFTFLLAQGGSLPPSQEPRRTHYDTSGELSQEVLRKNLDWRAQYLQSLYALPDADKYVFGLANTLQVMVAEFVWREGRLPTLEEFLNSPYNNLHPQAWVNPFTGEQIQWTQEPRRGYLYYHFPLTERDNLVIAPLIPRSPSFKIYERTLPPENWPEEQKKSLGVWGTWPGSEMDWPSPALAKQIDNACTITSVGPCYVRRYHAKKMNYTEAEWRTYTATHTLGFIFSRLFYLFESGMPESLEEVRQNYWWLYNTQLRNPFTGALIQEVPFYTNSPGDFIYATGTAGSIIVTPAFIPIGEKGRKLYPYDLGDIITLFQNLGLDADYVRGLEGRSLCDVAKEMEGQKLWEKEGKKFCIDKVFLTRAPRHGS